MNGVHCVSLPAPSLSHLMYAMEVIFDYVTIISPTIIIIIIITTRPKPAYGRQGLDWIVGPGYRVVVFSTNKTMGTNQKP